MDYRALSNAVSWERTPIEFEPLSERLIPEFDFPKKNDCKDFGKPCDRPLSITALSHGEFRGIC